MSTTRRVSSYATTPEADVVADCDRVICSKSEPPTP